MRSQNLRNYLEAGIQSLMPQAQRLLELRRILAGTLPPNLRRSCTIANYMQGKIVIFADNSAVAAKLKLMLPDLRNLFVKRAIEVTGIEIRVQPKQPPQTWEKSLELPAGALASLSELESQLPDSKLKSVISDLLGRHRSEH